MIPASRNKQRIFAQGDQADAVFCIEARKVTLTVVSRQGKQTVLAMLGVGSLLGGETKLAMLGQEPSFSNMFVCYLLTHSMRVEEDLVDQLSIPATNDWLVPCSRSHDLGKRVKPR